MAHFNFVISQNAKWGHAGFYIDCHRMTVPENILLQKSTDLDHLVVNKMAPSMCPDHCGTRWGSWFQTILYHISAAPLVFIRS